jgi:hypothetical protein
LTTLLNWESIFETIGGDPMSRHGRLCLWIAVFTLLVSTPALAFLIDDFSDGNDEGWTHLPRIVSGLPAVFDASSGRYRISSTDGVIENSTHISAFWDDSETDPAFSNGTFTVNARVDNVGTSAILLLRAIGLGSTYIFSLNNQLNALYILRASPTGASCSVLACTDVLGGFSMPISEHTGLHTSGERDRIGPQLYRMGSLRLDAR